MTPLDQEIGGGLGWFRGVVPAAGTTLGTIQETPPEPPGNSCKTSWSQGWFRAWNQPWTYPAKAYGWQKTPATQRKRNPDSLLDGRERNAAV